MFFNKFVAFATVAASAVSVGFASPAVAPTAVAHGAIPSTHVASVAPDAAVRGLCPFSDCYFVNFYSYILERQRQCFLLH